MTDRYKIDGHKLIYHPDRVAHMLAVQGDWVRAKGIYPIYMEISPIGACNHRCTFCAVDYLDYKPVRLKLEVLEKRLAEMGRLGVRSIMYAGEGEPMLHKEITEIVEATAKAGIDSAFTTNMTILPKHFLDRALPHISWIKTSINAGTPKTYAEIHQTKAKDFYKAVKNMRHAVEQRNREKIDCTLGAQALLLPENAEEMVTLAELCRDEIGLDYLVVKPYSQHMFSNTKRYEEIDYHVLSRIGEALSACNRDGFNVVFRQKTMKKYMSEDRYDHCHATPFLWAYVMADGTVSSCSAFLGDPRFELGNLNERSFQEIWEGSEREACFQRMLGDFDIAECRKNCRMDEINRYLHVLAAKSVPHINFI